MIKLQNLSESFEDSQIDCLFSLIDETFETDPRVSSLHNYYTRKKRLNADKKQVEDVDFCVHILAFIAVKIHDSIVIHVLARFMLKYRYVDGILWDDYVLKVVSMALLRASINKTRGIHVCELSNVKKIFPPEFMSSGIIKISNFLSCFYLSSCKEGSSYKFTLKKNSHNYLTVETIDGQLNAFDLTVVMCLLKQYKSLYSVYSNSGLEPSYRLRKIQSDSLPDNCFNVDIYQIINCVQSSYSGCGRLKVLHSLRKLSRTCVSWKQQVKPSLDTEMALNSIFLGYSGNLLNLICFEGSSGSLIQVELSRLMISMLDAQKGYTLINWHSFSSLVDCKLRLLYCYICHTVKPSSFQYEITVDDLCLNLYSSPPKNSSDFSQRRRKVRKLCRKLLSYIYLMPDFTIEFVYLKKCIYSLRVMRAKRALSLDSKSV